MSPLIGSDGDPSATLTMRELRKESTQAVSIGSMSEHRVQAQPIMDNTGNMPKGV